MTLGDDLLGATGRVVAGAFKGALAGVLIGAAVGAAILLAPGIAALLGGATFGAAGTIIAAHFTAHAAVATLLTPAAIGGAAGGIVIGATSIIPGIKTIFGKSKKPQQMETVSPQPVIQPPAMQPSVKNADEVNMYGNGNNWQQGVDQSRQQTSTGRSA